MNFELDDVQRMLKDGIHRYLTHNYDAEARRRVLHGGGCLEENWRHFVEMGWLGASLSEEEGGLGGGAAETVILMEEFGKALVVEPFLPIAVLAVQTLIGTGAPAATDLVRAIVAGKRKVVLAHGEAAGRSMIEHVATRAQRTDDIFTLHGTKTLVLGGPYADSMIVSARTSGADRDRHGITLFLLDAKAMGARRDFRLAEGAWASELPLDGVEVHASAVLGDVDGGWPALDRGHMHAILGICAEAVGAMDSALWITRDYVRIRRQFGRPIGTFQALQHRMADMLIELELSRSVVFRALSLIDAAPAIRSPALSVAKAQIGRSAHFVGSQAIQLHGGIGVTEEHIIGQYFKRLTAIQNMFGTVSFHLGRIGAGYNAPSTVLSEEKELLHAVS